MKKGISLVSLVVAILILTILAGIVVVSGLQSTSAASATMYAMELLNIQNNVDEYHLRYQKYPVSNEITLNVADIESGYLYQFEDENTVDGTITFKSIDLGLVGLSDLEYGKFEQAKDIYVLSETTGKVYYLLGIEYEGKIHYTLTDELYELAGIQPNKLIAENEIKKLDVIFIPSSIEYTNQPVTVQIKLPKEAEINSVTATEGKSVSSETTSNLYKAVSVNETTENKAGNYEIEVIYTYNGATKTVNYKVANFDNTLPTISVDETKDGNIRVVKVQAEDNLSGIKLVKYAEAKVADSTYFKNYGKVISGTEVRLNEDIKYTLYVEDNAGNHKMMTSTAYAIYSDTDNSLTFLRTTEPITKGGTYEGKQVTELYTGFEETSYAEKTDVPWYAYRSNIMSVTVKDKIQPLRTAYWFYEAKKCSNLDLAKMDVSQVVNMENMFYHTGSEVTEFNIKGLNNWNTSKVEWMTSMFSNTGINATTYNIGDLSTWDVSNVISMESMFYQAGKNAKKFDIGNLDNWNTSNVRNWGMYSMFNQAGRYAEEFNIGKLDKWDLSRITQCGYMFMYTGTRDTTWSIGDISNWNTSKAQDMESMFHGAGQRSTNFTLGNLSTKEIIKSDGTKYLAWDVSNVTRMKNMFHQTGHLSASWSIGDISNWNVLKVTTMEGMFQNIATEVRGETVFTLGDLTKWNTSNVTNMTNMFNYTAPNADWSLDLSTWKVPLVTAYEGFNSGINKVISPKFN